MHPYIIVLSLSIKFEALVCIFHSFPCRYNCIIIHVLTWTKFKLSSLTLRLCYLIWLMLFWSLCRKEYRKYFGWILRSEPFSKCVNLRFSKCVYGGSVTVYCVVVNSGCSLWWWVGWRRSTAVAMLSTTSARHSTSSGRNCSTYFTRRTLGHASISSSTLLLVPKAVTINTIYLNNHRIEVLVNRDYYTMRFKYLK